MKAIIQFILLFFLTTNLVAQNKLVFKTEAIDSLLIWMQNGCDKNNITNLTIQPSTQLMEQIIRKREKNVPEFKIILKEFNCNDSISGSFYLLNDANKRQLEITKLLKELKKSDFSENVYKRAIKYFPDYYTPPRNYEVFYTAVGWQWGDAMSFNYIVQNGEYTLSDEGTPAIIFNLTLVSASYGNTLSEQMKAMENVMSHELFHAIFSDYLKSNWHSWDSENIGNSALYLMLNEGLAHYISDGKLLQEDYTKDDKLRQKEKKAFTMLSDSAKVIFNTKRQDEERKSALNRGLFGKYWGKYISISGLFMSYHIEQYYGTESLKDCIKNGPLFFIRKYEKLQKINTELPQLPDEIIEFVK